MKAIKVAASITGGIWYVMGKGNVLKPLTARLKSGTAKSRRGCRACPDAISKYFEEGLAFSGELSFQFVRVIALTAGPRLFSIRVPATLPIESIQHPDEVEERFPVRPFFFERRITEANLDPLNPAVVVDTSIFHVP